MVLVHGSQAHHEVDGRSTSQDVGGRDNGTTATEPLGGAGLIEGCSLGIQLHVAGVDARAVHPWVVEVALSCLNEKHLEVVVEVSEPSGVLESRLVSDEVMGVSYLPATTQPQLPPPQTIMSNSSGRGDMFAFVMSISHCLIGKLVRFETARVLKTMGL
jgi:hypothetical protein